MDVIRRFVWGTATLGVLAILGGTSALAFSGDAADADGAGSAGTQDQPAIVRVAHSASWIRTAPAPAAPAAPPSSRWMAPHTAPAPR